LAASLPKKRLTSWQVGGAIAPFAIATAIRVVSALPTPHEPYRHHGPSTQRRDCREKRVFPVLIKSGTSS
jgi:hypothetical protein